jgi:hypothetical protein
MNERIRQLAEQAAGTKKYVPPVWQFYDHELEKLVELIVHECIDQAHGVGTLRGANDDMTYGADVAAGRIAKHFGVK